MDLPYFQNILIFLIKGLHKNCFIFMIHNNIKPNAHLTPRITTAIKKCYKKTGRNILRIEIHTHKDSYLLSDYCNNIFSGSMFILDT